MNDNNSTKIIKASPIEALQARFGANEWPEFLALQQNDLVMTLRLFVPESLLWFSGHFPENPILPGIVQTHWACELSRLLFAVTTPFEKITKLRFKTVVPPNTELILLLENEIELKHIAFLYTCEGIVISSGNVKFREVL